MQARFTRVFVALIALALTAGVVPTGKPEDVGLSSERLHRINQLVQRYIDEKQIAGAVTVVTCRGRVAHLELRGLMDIEAKTPMRRDAIFRIASRTKPVTSVAIRMLLEEGKVRLNDPVSKFIATAPTRSRPTSRVSDSCRSTFSRARSGGTAAWPASTRWAGSSRSPRG